MFLSSFNKQCECLKFHRSWETARSSKATEEFFDIDLGDTHNYHALDPLRCHLFDIHSINLEDDPNTTTFAGSSTHRDMPIDPRTGHAVSKLMYEYKSNSATVAKSLISDKSQFTLQEQRRCIDAIEKLHLNLLTTAEETNREYYIAVAELRQQEKSTFSTRVQMHFDRTLSRRCTNVPSEKKEFIEAIWKKSVASAMQRFANRWYRIQTSIPLTTIDSAKNPIDAKIIHTAEEGYVFKTSMANRKYLYKTADSLLNYYNAEKMSRNRQHIRDKCNVLANEFDCDVVLPLSSMCLLLDYASNTSTNWMMEFVIENVPGSSVFERKCRIIIDRPLPRTTMTGPEMQKVAHKYLMRSVMTPHIEEVYSCDEKRVLRRTTKENHNSSEPMEYDCCLFDDYLAKVYAKHAELIQPKGNTMYKVCELRDRQDENTRLRVLVTSKQDGYQLNSNDQTIEYVNYSEKLEFQNEFGAEQMTKSELLREWCRCYFRPESVTNRGKIYL